MSQQRRWTEQDLRDLQQQRAKAAKPAKYRNVKVIVGEDTFDSKHEYAVWQELLLRQKAGELKTLQRQVHFALCAYVRSECSAVQVAEYVADFTYDERIPAGWRFVVADAKSAATSRDKVYVLKKRWLKAQEGIEIVEL